jgi:tripartite-type tricarboxylate transporter receptor subunit TctC
MNFRRGPVVAAIWLASLTLLNSTTGTRAAPDFYLGKSVQIIVGNPAGTGFDLYARALAQYMPKYIPGRPSIVVSNMPGASGVRAVQYLSSSAPRDGTVFGTFNVNLLSLSVTEPETARNVDFDNLNWLGSMASGSKACFAWSQSGVATLDDLKTRKLIIGSSGRGSGDFFGSILKTLYGDRVQIVVGYASNPDVWLAFEKGEASGNCTGWDVVPQLKPDWVRDHKINVLVQFARKPMEGLEHVPLIFDLPMPEDLRGAIAFLTLADGAVRPYAAPPGVPEDRIDILRAAFAQTLKDDEFLAFARQGNLTLDYVDAEKLAQMAKEITNTPKDAVETARKLGQ